MPAAVGGSNLHFFGDVWELTSSPAIPYPGNRPRGATGAGFPQGIASFTWQDDRLSESLPFGSRGGIAVEHNFPLDAEYVFKVDLSRNLDGAQIRGVREMEVRIDQTLVSSLTIDASKAGMGSGKKGVKTPNLSTCAAIVSAAAWHTASLRMVSTPM